MHVESILSVPLLSGLPLQEAVPLAGAEPNGSHIFGCTSGAAANKVVGCRFQDVLPRSSKVVEKGEESVVPSSEWRVGPMVLPMKT